MKMNDAATVPELVCLARGINPPPGALEGTCVYCQRRTLYGHKHKNKPDSCATYHLIRGGTVVCPTCAHMRSERWLYRASMWEASADGFRKFKLTEARDCLMNPPKPPFAQFYTRTWKKNGWLNMINDVNWSRERYMVMLDYDRILVTADRRDRMMTLAGGLLTAGAKKADLLSGKLPAKAISSLGVEALSKLEEVRQYASDPLWELVVYVARNQERHSA